MRLDYDLARGRLDALSAFLTRRRPLWEERPFVQESLSWEEEYPAVARWCRGLSTEEVASGQGSPGCEGDHLPAEFVSWGEEARALTALPAYPGVALKGADSVALAQGVPGRKWRQLCAFAGVVQPLLDPGLLGMVDWCAGKGHLGRLMGLGTGLPVTLLERDPQLCRIGERAAAAFGVRCEFIPEDVRARRHLPRAPRTQALLSLHACGSLSDDAIVLASQQKVGQIFVAGCCYHRMNGESRYRPLSRWGRGRDLNLSYGAMRLATAEEVVARPAIRARRQRELSFRLGLCGVREEHGGGVAASEEKIPSRWFRLPFKDFCEAVARREGWECRSGWPAEQREQDAWERGRVVQGLGLVRCLFRRSIEQWVLLDRALYLLEQGREVRLGVFCPRELTPRNTLLVSTLGRG